MPTLPIVGTSGGICIRNLASRSFDYQGKGTGFRDQGTGKQRRGAGTQRGPLAATKAESQTQESPELIRSDYEMNAETQRRKHGRWTVKPVLALKMWFPIQFREASFRSFAMTGTVATSGIAPCHQSPELCVSAPLRFHLFGYLSFQKNS